MHHRRRGRWLQMCAAPRAGSGKTYTMTGLLADADQVTHRPSGMRDSIRQPPGTRELLWQLPCARMLASFRRMSWPGAPWRAGGLP